MTCHRAVKKDSREIQRLAALGNEATPFPSRQVYTVEDFVFFSHARHRKAGIDCASCHGAVAERDVIIQEVPTTMKSCVACHKARQASSDCNTCHELGQ
jgi:c(7)-type cytochrome triheme protein